MEKVERAETSGMPGIYWLPAVFLASASVMAIELALTRLFSALLWYHFVFIAVSLTIFGLALGGLLIYRSAKIRSLGPLLLTPAGGAVILMVAAFNALPLAKVWPLYLLFSLPALVIIGAFQSLAFKVHDRRGGCILRICSARPWERAYPWRQSGIFLSPALWPPSR